MNPFGKMRKFKWFIDDTLYLLLLGNCAIVNFQAQIMVPFAQKLGLIFMLA